MTEELKPCPFCGGTPIQRWYLSNLNEPMTSVIRCTSCRAGVSDYTEDIAISIWNNRVKG